MTRSRKILWLFAVVVVGYIGSSSLPSGTALVSGARSKEAAATDLRTKIAKADSALSDTANFATNLAIARSLVPVQPDLPEVIALIDGAVKLSGLRWLSGAPSAVSADTIESFQQWTLLLTLSGSARALPSFLQNLHALPRLIVVDSVQIRGDREATISITLRFFAAVGAPEAFAAENAAAASTTLPGQP